MTVVLPKKLEFQIFEGKQYTLLPAATTYAAAYIERIDGGSRYWTTCEVDGTWYLAIRASSSGYLHHLQTTYLTLIYIHKYELEVRQ